MLAEHVERFLSLRRALGFKLKGVARNLRAYASFSAARGDTHIRTTTALAWAAEASSPLVRYIRLRDVVRFARFLHAEAPAHEVPPLTPCRRPYVRKPPYIYTPDEIVRLIEASHQLRPSYPLRRKAYSTMIGLFAATGLRASEALDLHLDDVSRDGVVHVRRTKFGKSRLVPLHPTAKKALDRYLAVRRRVATTDDHVFLSGRNERISNVMLDYTFRRILKLAKLAPKRERPPRIHDLRHTFATRALENCGAAHCSVSQHFVAISTYLGHADIQNTYWYLEATPELMANIAAASEAFVHGGSR